MTYCDRMLRMGDVVIQRDVTIVGAGPVGLFCVFALGMADLSACAVDSLEVVGGKCALLYPEKPIYDIPAIVSLTGAELVERLKEQAQPFNPQYLLSRRVMSLVRNEHKKEFVLETHAGDRIVSKAVIISAGAGMFVPNKPSIEGIEAFEDKTVLYSVVRPEILEGKKIVIAGGGDSALDWALLLKDKAASVTLVHRRETFRAHESTQKPLREAIAAKKIILKAPYQLSGIDGSNGILSSVKITRSDGAQESLEADYLLPFFGIATNLGSIAMWGATMSARHIVVDPTTCLTSLEGVYAVGDVCIYPHKRKLIAVGFSEAMYAAQSIYHYVRGKDLRMGYSTNMGIPGIK